MTFWLNIRFNLQNQIHIFTASVKENQKGYSNVEEKIVYILKGKQETTSIP